MNYPDCMGTHEKGTDVGVFYNKCTFVIVDEYRNKVVNAVMFLESLNWGWSRFSM